ncbi:hypothetical protein diail_3135 [Diaporthe ilicicola]|nr:hypothetical protein diail_3135 [Diaporthe ilicicola]
MAFLVSRQETQADVYQLAPLTPEGLGFAVEAVAIALGIASLIVISLRVYARLALSGLLSRSSGLDDTLAVIGTVSSLFPAADGPTQGDHLSMIDYLILTT